MVNRKRPNKAHIPAGFTSEMGTSSQASGSRQRNVLPATNGSSTPPKIKQKNVLEGGKIGGSETPWSPAKMIGVGAAWIHMTVPPYLNWAIMMALIFGGCCSNVRTVP